MNPLLARQRRGDPTALEELGHELLPFVQAAVIAHSLQPRDPGAVLIAFKESIAFATATAPDETFFAAVVQRVRDRLGAIPLAPEDPGQAEALECLSQLAPLTILEREQVLARFVERVPGTLLAAHFLLEPAALASVLSRGAALLVGPPASGDWSSQPSLLDPDAAPVAQFVELENRLTVLAIDVTVLDQSPLAAPVPLPVLKQGFATQIPVEHYPSKVKTQHAVDLPAEVSRFVAPAPVTVPIPMVPENTPKLPMPAIARKAEVVDHTEPSARPLKLPEETELRGTALREPVVTRVDPIAQATRQPVITRVVESVESVPPTTRVPVGSRASPLWFWAGAALCAMLGVGLYWGLISTATSRVRSGWELVPVIVAKQNLPEGTLLTLDDMSTRQVPEKMVTLSVVKPEAVEGVVGQKLRVALQAGDFINWEQFESSKLHLRLSKQIQKKLRAYSIPLSELKSVNGFVRADSNTDLVMTLTHGNSPTLGHTVLKNVKVIAVGSPNSVMIGRLKHRYTDVSVLLAPEEAELLSLAVREGDLTATLRNDDDHDLLSEVATGVARRKATISTLLDRNVDTLEVYRQQREKLTKQAH